MLKISALQMHPQLGNLKANMEKILSFYDSSNADIVITPELALSGYSPMDNLFSIDFQEAIKKHIEIIKNYTTHKKATLILGTPYFEDGKIYNVALCINDGEIVEIIYKNKRPNYGVFNEHRYFAAKESANIIEINNKNIAIFVCEDMWHANIVDSLVGANVELIISINASPFEGISKHTSRLQVAKYATTTLQAPLLYLNTVGGVDDVIFDGSSFLMDSHGNELGCLAHAKEDSLNFSVAHKKIDMDTALRRYDGSENDKNQLIYEAIQLGLKDFLKSTGFKGVIIGMSGGIDSTLTATIAADTLGAENVLGISMPSQYTSQLSYDIIEDIKNNLGIKIIEIPIDSLVKSYEESLHNKLNLNENNVLDNIQARIRGQILMAHANQYNNFMVLTTGNKSEIATGYCTLYGDTCGGYNLLKDLYKTEVFELSKWRNQKSPVIPTMAIERKPSAELKENQYDEDSLMDYNTLDAILYQIIEKNTPQQHLYKLFDSGLVDKTLKLLKNSHYKRLQSPMGANISTRPFGKAFLYNISDSFKGK
ncbi:MAG: NAD+ synthase [Alphaproteobacteria bacterium]|jgi:NAD+ synthase (glutamine-hydrolysing)|nr:NAD+ synthase [Alphaproteobacteria bacterium]